MKKLFELMNDPVFIFAMMIIVMVSLVEIVQ